MTNRDSVYTPKNCDITSGTAYRPLKIIYIALTSKKRKSDFKSPNSNGDFASGYGLPAVKIYITLTSKPSHMPFLEP
jgi:hypothetical protein